MRAKGLPARFGRDARGFCREILCREIFCRELFRWTATTIAVGFGLGFRLRRSRGPTVSLW